jgi:hypothetical protein
MVTYRATNDPEYRSALRTMKSTVIPCWRGCGRRATSPDHDPPTSTHTHIRGTGCCVLRPSCLPCQNRQGATITNTRRSSGYNW